MSTLQLLLDLPKATLKLAKPLPTNFDKIPQLNASEEILVALNRKRFSPHSVALLLLLPFVAAAASAQTPLKTINNPSGGQIVYGTVDGQSTEPAAMGAILRSLHNQYGDRPEVGRVFRYKGTNSVAVFFTLVKRNQGNAQVAGLLIAAKVSAGRVEAALVTDDAAHFGTSINPMLNTLFGEWHPAGANAAGPGSSSGSGAGGGNVNASSSGHASAGVAPLHQYVLPDRSASVGLPDGWQVSQGSGGGTISATGPNGEAINLDSPFLAWDTRNPHVQQTMRLLQQGSLSNSAYAKALYYPYGGDLGKMLVELNRMKRQKAGLPVPNIQITGETPLPGSGPQHCARFTGQIEPADGKGPSEMVAVYCVGQVSPMGQYGSQVYVTAVPLPFADKERATMGAILASFTLDMNVVNAEAHAIAQPAIDAIHEVGRRAAAQADAAHAANDAHNAAVEKQWDNDDKRSQAFSNYQLDKAVIEDTQTGTHRTLWNKAADDMVARDPQRYQYVDAPNYWKGIDY